MLVKKIKYQKWEGEGGYQNSKPFYLDQILLSLGHLWENLKKLKYSGIKYFKKCRRQQRTNFQHRTPQSKQMNKEY